MAQYPVCEKQLLQRRGQIRKDTFRAPKSGTGEQLLLLDCRAKARVKLMFFTDTGISEAHVKGAFSHRRRPKLS